jgi:hypothetical protein
VKQSPVATANVYMYMHTLKLAHGRTLHDDIGAIGRLSMRFRIFSTPRVIPFSERLRDQSTPSATGRTRTQVDTTSHPTRNGVTLTQILTIRVVRPNST